MPQFRLFAYFMLVSTLAVSCPRALNAEEAAEHGSLPGTKPLVWEGDIASRLVDGVDKFLLAETAKSIESRPATSQRDLSSPEKYAASIEPNRQRLAHILGVRDPRVAFDAHGAASAPRPSRPWWAKGPATRCSPFAGRPSATSTARGCCWCPRAKPVADVVAIPDADQTPEMLAGLVEGVPAESQFARRLAESGCRVLVPALVNRRIQQHGRAKLTNREYLYRVGLRAGPAPDRLRGAEGAGRRSIGSPRKPAQSDPRIGVIGWGEGGHAGPVRRRARPADRRRLRQRLLRLAAERLAGADRPQRVRPAGAVRRRGAGEPDRPAAAGRRGGQGPEGRVPPRHGRRPGHGSSRPSWTTCAARSQRAEQLAAGLARRPQIETGRQRRRPAGRSARRRRWRRCSKRSARARSSRRRAGAANAARRASTPTPGSSGRSTSSTATTSELLAESPDVRQEFFAKLDTSSLGEVREDGRARTASTSTTR